MGTITRQSYLEDLEQLRQSIKLMGDKVGRAISLSMSALENSNIQLAREVMRNDDEIDEINIEIEDKCMLLIAKQQPLARDLRIITTALKISTDLERIGDHAFDIAKITVESNEDGHEHKVGELAQMSEFAEQMLREAVEAYGRFDVSMAEKVCRDDDVVDRMYAEIFRTLSQIAVDDLLVVKQTTRLIFVARYLERIADHATNIAEWVIYLATGDRIRKL